MQQSKILKRDKQDSARELTLILLMCAEKIMSMGNWFISDDVQWPQGFLILKKYHLKRHTLINKVKSLYFFIFRNLWFKKSWTLLKVLTLHILCEPRNCFTSAFSFSRYRNHRQWISLCSRQTLSAPELISRFQLF